MAKYIKWAKKVIIRAVEIKCPNCNEWNYVKGKFDSNVDNLTKCKKCRKRIFFKPIVEVR